MATAAEREVELTKHDQELTEVQRAADAAREHDRQRTEHEHKVDRAHEALIEESKRQHFLEHEMCS